MAVTIRAIRYGLVVLAAAVGAGRYVAAEVGQRDGIVLLYIGSAAGGGLHGAPGYLGVDVSDVTEEQVGALRLKEARGAMITLVDHDAPAGKAGLRERDVVLQMNGQVIEGEEQFRRMLRESPPGRTVVLLLSRDGQQFSKTVQMGIREEVERRAWDEHFKVPEPQDVPMENVVGTLVPTPAPGPAPVIHAGNSFIGTILMTPAYTGAMLEQVSSQLASMFGVQGGGGLFVRGVAENSPAAQAGMRAGDVVVRANAKRVSTTGDWSKAIKNSKGRPMAVVVLRDKREQTLTLVPDAKKRSSLDVPSEDAPAVVARVGMLWVTGS